MAVEIKDMSVDRPSHPSVNDPAEMRIREEIRNAALSTKLGQEMFAKIDQLQHDYFRRSLTMLDRPQQIHDETQTLLENLATTTNARIVDGEAYLASLPKGRPVIAAVNHFSSYKIVPIRPAELGLENIGEGQIEAYPILYAPLMPVAKALGDNLYDGHMEAPSPIDQIQVAAGIVVVPDPNKALQHEQHKSFPIVLERTKSHFVQHPNSLLVSFAEGETSGKRNGGGPYNLAPFKTGAFVTAAEEKVPVLPVGMYFNPDSGYELGILEPIYPESGKEREYYVELAEQTRQKMQLWLNTRQRTPSQ
jgi:hypothetical protein